MTIDAPSADPADVLLALTDEGRRFLADRHLATLSTIGPHGDIHVVAVGFTLGDDGCLRITTNDRSQKIRNLERDPRATVAQVDGRHWLSIAGHAEIERDAEAVAHAVALYTNRYREPGENPNRVVIRITPERIMSSPGLRSMRNA
ncbi:pyridoxamine 5'-phosphate oxidase family protein [Agromyces aerolatus]|uniref:pyridoxamine 5'-phosphate oxidase family protein n=1 Tax=Agromyces sp. LY-1074 TaxID=3074080 RepID=UPI0028592736|nr:MULTISPECIES: PPOX class F420-dependent oxidoreductase [unclassified Agromyces]MDR5699863.1 PPOX class F420-dependent oxidoreductase [Agromyces sp. LY-1074]MDR5706325.1 PPOX class F420-dependent oxidoreductase [Agromyces sp. LY-1358]